MLHCVGEHPMEGMVGEGRGDLPCTLRIPS